MLRLRPLGVLKPLPNGQHISVLSLPCGNKPVLSRAVSVISHVKQNHVVASLVEPSCGNKRLMICLAGPNAVDNDDPRIVGSMVHDPCREGDGFVWYINGHVVPSIKPQRFKVRGQSLVLLMSDGGHVFVPQGDAEVVRRVSRRMA